MFCPFSFCRDIFIFIALNDRVVVQMKITESILVKVFWYILPLAAITLGKLLNVWVKITVKVAAPCHIGLHFQQTWSTAQVRHLKFTLCLGQKHLNRWLIRCKCWQEGLISKVPFLQDVCRSWRLHFIYLLKVNG